jgi:hypothetical protein
MLHPEPTVDRTRLVELSFSGGVAPEVDVFRNGKRLGRASNRGSYLDEVDARTSGTLVYQVCDRGTAVCTEPLTVVVPKG